MVLSKEGCNGVLSLKGSKIESAVSSIVKRLQTVPDLQWFDLMSFQFYDGVKALYIQ